jgi:formate hydrogenlyase transcriptional activator
MIVSGQPELPKVDPLHPAFTPPAPSSPREHLEMLRRVTRSIAATQDLQVLLGSIVTALVQHAGAAVARVFLYLDDDRCAVCRAHGGHAGAQQSGGAKCLHVCASAGVLTETAGPDHLFPLTTPSVPAKVALERKPFLSNDLMQDVGHEIAPELRAALSAAGITAAGAYPLDFRGELLGVIGMLSRRPFEPRAWELQSIFADQAAMAVKSAQLFEELEHHRKRLQAENAYLRQEIRTERGFEEIVGESPVLRAVVRQVKQVAAVDTTVLLTGETGTGKELVARAIHALSPRSDRPMIKVNCGAIPQGVVESELFGHERGAFTGALQRRIGRFELADKGTLFMDEVGELPLDTQVKLLRVLQEQEFERLGGTRAMKVDVRLVAATNRDLEREVAEGRCRRDLFYRLNVFPVHVPPLRERPGDIPLLVGHFLAHFQRKLGKPLKGITPEGLERLQRYSWPGNIRELQNVLERACVLARGPIVEIADEMRAPGASACEPDAEEPVLSLEESERQHVRRALEAANGKIHGPAGAAALLGVNGSTLRSRMQKLGIARHVS